MDFNRKENLIVKKILLTNRYSGRPLEIVREYLPAGFELIFLEQQTKECLEESIKDADYLLAGGRMRITKEILSCAGKLAMIQRSGVGLDSLDLEAIKARGIPLYVNRGVNTESVAEHTLMLILASLRRLTVIHRNTANGMWSKQAQGVTTGELRGKTVGIIGMGSVGRAVAHLLQPFHVTILYNDRVQIDDKDAVCGAHFVSLQELLGSSDIISLNCSLTAETAGIINRHTLEMMKPGTILVNTARGDLVVTEDLAQALSSGKLSFAGIDVYEKEPIPEDYPLMKLENVILTPHIAGVTADSFKRMMHDAFRNIECFEHGDLKKIEPFRYL